MTRKETLKQAIKVFNKINKRAIEREGGIIYNYVIDEENLMIIIKNRILYKPEMDIINYLYIELDSNELRIQF